MEMQSSVSDALMAFYAVYMAVLYLVLLVFGVISYILCGKSLSAIARRRGIEKPWLAWVPVGNLWLLGCISDQYRYVVHHQETNRRGKLMVMGIITSVAAVVLSVASGLMTGLLQSDASAESALALSAFAMVVVYLVLAVAVVMSVLQFMAYYDLFRSCDPDKSLVFLLVSIFASFPMPFFVYSCRNKDLGMPPRHDAPELPGE